MAGRIPIPHKPRPCDTCKGQGFTLPVDGAAMRKLREGVGLSQREMAARTGLSPSYLSDMESGRRPMSEEIAARIMSICGGV